MTHRTARHLAALAGAAAVALGAAASARADAGPNPDPSIVTRWQPCEPGSSGPGTGVTVVVDFTTLGDHDVRVGCAPGPQTSGLDALQHAGFTVGGTRDYGLSFVCRIDGLPGTTGPDAQACQRAAPVDAYWSYWHGRAGGAWSYSGTGAGGYTPVTGQVEGWAFGSSPKPRIVPPGNPEPFVLPDPQTDLATASSDLRSWASEFSLQTGGTSVTGSDVSPAAVVSWAASGESLTALGPRLAAYHDPDAIARAVGRGRPFTAKLYRAQAGDASLVGLALVAQGIDPTALAGGQDLRTELLAEVQPDGAIPDDDAADPYGGPDTLGAPDPETQADSIELLSLTGGAPAATVTALAAMQSADGSFRDDPSTTAEVVIAAATARANGTAGLDDVIARGAAALIADQHADGSVGDQGVADTTLPAALTARALYLAGESDAAALSRGWVTRFQITPAIAIADADGSSDLGALLPTVDQMREASRYGIGGADQASDAASTGVLALPALGHDPTAVLRPVPSPPTSATITPTTPVPTPAPTPTPTSRAPTTTTPPRAAAPGRLRARLTGPAPRTGALARGGRLRVTVTAQSTGPCSVTASVTRRTARVLRLSSPTLGRGRARCLAGRRVTVSVRLGGRARRALRTARSPVVVGLTVRVADRSTSLRLRLRLRLRASRHPSPSHRGHS